MPLYDYRCDECRQLFEARISLKERDEGVVPPCPGCTSRQVTQILKPVGLVKKDTSRGNCSSGFG